MISINLANFITVGIIAIIFLALFRFVAKAAGFNSPV